jgi:hypothetical protein
VPPFSFELDLSKHRIFRMQLNKLLVLSIIFVSGCYQDPQVSLLKSELEKSQQQLTDLQSKVEKIEKSVDENQKKYEFDKVFNSLNKIAYLTPGSEGYSSVNFDLGTLTVSLRDIKPYANGSKITLEFGNPLATTINGLNMTIDWGKVDNNGYAINESSKSKNITLNESLFPAKWTQASIVLDGVAPTELGFVRLKDLHHTGIRLSK